MVVETASRNLLVCSRLKSLRSVRISLRAKEKLES